MIGEAMVMLTLARFVLEKTGGDSMPEVVDNLERYRARIAQPPAARRGRSLRGARPGRHGAGGRWVDEVAADASEDSEARVDVVLVGLPGSGKTAIGRRLANRHGAAFVDLDDWIEETAGRPDPGDLRRRTASRRSGAWSARRSPPWDRPTPTRPSAA